MPTRSQTANVHTSPLPARLEPMQLVRPNPCRMREMVYRLIVGEVERIVALEASDILTELHQQAVICISKMLETMCTKFKAYHNEIVASLESDKDVSQEEVFFNEHQRKCMKFIDCLGDVLPKPQPSVPSPASVNIRMVDRQQNLLGDSVQTIKRAVEDPDLVDAHVLTSYLDEIKSLESDLQGLKKGILSFDNMGERVRKPSDIKQMLFDLQVEISHLTEQTKNEPTSN